ncbi:MAG: winged helix DNA-binding domain-containing protein [Acidimicrobiia bacterium]|nr:winged helix DNA-binding domain-containing protein [Acidimicrobiia bacterium]
MRLVTNQERRARLGTRHDLAVPSVDVVSVSRDLVGFHSSDPASVYLSARARVVDFDPSVLERELYEKRTLVRMLGMRRTMFVVPRDLAPVIDAACTRGLYEGQLRRFVKMVETHGITTDGVGWCARISDDVLASLRKRGSATAREITEDVPELGIKMRMNVGKKYEGNIGVSTRILFLLATSGSIVRARPLGTWVSSQYRWALTEEWLGEPIPHVDTDVARRDLVATWLLRFGPGTFEDIKWWTGWGVRDTRKALEESGAVEVELEEGAGYLHPDDLELVADPAPWIAFLPGLDPTTMGWKQRDWYLTSAEDVLFDSNGNAGPTVWLNGRIVGGWAHHDSGEVRVRLLEEVPGSAKDRIAGGALELADWMGDLRLRTRFSVPLEKELKRE